MIGIASWIRGACLRGQRRAGSATALGGARQSWLLGAVVTLMVLGAADRAHAACSGAGSPTVTCNGVVVNPGQSCQNVSDIQAAAPYVVWQCNEASARAIYSNTQSGTQGVRRLTQRANPGQQFARITADNGETEFHGFSIVPTLTYQHSATLSGYLSGSVGRQKYELENAGTTPAGFGSTFSSVEYDVVTETATFGINWSPMEHLSGSATYTFFNSSDSVRNTGHDLTLRSTFEIAEEWDLTSSLRYLGYDPASNTLDDYDTIVFTLGLVGRF